MQEACGPGRARERVQGTEYTTKTAQQKPDKLNSSLLHLLDIPHWKKPGLADADVFMLAKEISMVSADLTASVRLSHRSGYGVNGGARVTLPHVIRVTHYYYSSTSQSGMR
jgi:hypothetical protein